MESWVLFNIFYYLLKKIEYKRKLELKYVKIFEVYKVLLDCLLKEFVNLILKNINIMKYIDLKLFFFLNIYKDMVLIVFSYL